MSGLVDRLLDLPGWLVLVVAGLVVLTEDALFVGFVIPGETVALLAGAAAKLGHVSLAGVLAVVIIAAVVGDTIGYQIGRHTGPRLLGMHFLDERHERLDQARDLLARRGGSASSSAAGSRSSARSCRPWPAPPGCPTPRSWP